MPTPEEVLNTASRINLNIPEAHVDDYLQLLTKTEEACALVLAQEGMSVLIKRQTLAYSTADYKPKPDVARFPRTNIHRPTGKDNPLNGWAWRADAGDPVDSSGKLLSGKRVVFKDTICMAEVPLLFGTDAFEGFVREFDGSATQRAELPSRRRCHGRFASPRERRSRPWQGCLRGGPDERRPEYWLICPELLPWRYFLFVTLWSCREPIHPGILYRWLLLRLRCTDCLWCRRHGHGR